MCRPKFKNLWFCGYGTRSDCATLSRFKKTSERVNGRDIGPILEYLSVCRSPYQASNAHRSFHDLEAKIDRIDGPAKVNLLA